MPKAKTAPVVDRVPPPAHFLDPAATYNTVLTTLRSTFVR
jgi:hypothetical protein